MRIQGFSIIEILIVVSIVAILATIALPSYNDAMTKSRRTDGKVALMDLATRMERYYSEHHSYSDASIAPDGSSSTQVLNSNLSPEGWYQLQISAQSDSSYTISAVPQNAQASSDLTCATFSYDNLGQEGISGSGSVSDCW
jgi:type IV pilus assembly protein PilE